MNILAQNKWQKWQYQLRVVRLFGFDPKVAFVSHSTFGQPLTSRTKHIKKAVEILKEKNVNFEFDGDMQPDVALNEEYKNLYPFSKIVGNANIPYNARTT